ncbi:MAG: TetR/AcrR family transcriptional regulator [Clostridia bacterium]|nr:TetR/AcrR family transcriptional regulator [Clostridia bacterium]
MQRLKDEVRQKIIQAGKIRFQKNGYENTSMKDIAFDSGISIGNIYRYFLTKKHILNEILGEIEIEIEKFFQGLPSSYEEINMHYLFGMISDLTIKIAKENKDTLKVMFNSQNESQFMAFKEKILDLFKNKMITIAKSMGNEEEISYVICDAIARAEFEGFTCIVKNDIDDIDTLRKNLEIYEKLMIENLGDRVLEVIKK